MKMLKPLQKGMRVKASAVTVILTMILLVTIAPNSYSKNLGAIGDTYAIEESDFLEFIKARAHSMEKSGELKKLQADLQKRAVLLRDRPQPVKNIEHTVEAKSWLYNPSIILDHDVITHDGKLIAKRGTIINPLMTVPLTKSLIFIDADNKKDVQWALAMDKKLKSRDKIILVKGSILNEENRFQRPIYFDQNGVLTSRFNIQHVPAIVKQEGLSLRIKEVIP